eukprot:6197163-Pleurochrysis_carterae.AAC.2
MQADALPTTRYQAMDTAVWEVRHPSIWASLEKACTHCFDRFLPPPSAAFSTLSTSTIFGSRLRRGRCACATARRTLARKTSNRTRRRCVFETRKICFQSTF